MEFSNEAERSLIMTTNILDLKGHIGLVTGAGQGVGRAVALHFANNGAGGVVVNDYVLARAEAVAIEVERAGCAALAVQSDVTDFASVGAMFEQARGKFGRVDILVNNAGNAGADPRAVSRKPFWEQEPKDWHAFLGTNLFGVLNCVRHAVPGGGERGGRRLRGPRLGGGRGRRGRGGGRKKKKKPDTLP